MTSRSDDLEDHVCRFMDCHVESKTPCIVGFSGGVDSSALLHLLYRLRHPVHVVHVDHGWREESASEAAILEKRVTALGIPFTCCRLTPCPQGENAEDWSRRQRMACFSTVASSVGTDIVLLAHQADDQAEVVVKRFLEGASLPKFRGMRPIEKIGTLRLMRPLLSIRRSQLLAYLHERSVPYLNDPTNTDTTYLRARMRETIFPFLRDTFGKGFDNSVLRVASEAADLEQYLHQECSRLFSVHLTPEAAFATLREDGSSPPFLVRRLVDQLKESVFLPSFSRQQVEGAVKTFCGKPSGSKRFFVGRGVLIVERGFMVAFRVRPQDIDATPFDEEEGSCTMAAWNLSWTTATAIDQGKRDWKALFSGEPVTVNIPQGPFSVCTTSDRLLRSTSSAFKSTSHFVSLRPLVPAFVQGFTLVADPLSGYTLSLPSGSPCLAVTIQRVVPGTA